ncbi:MAG: adenylate/guanylate cyclase domain-containing protein [Actinomycetota bacterium]
MIVPKTRYTPDGAPRIAYQVFGEGSRDIVLVWGIASHVDQAWEVPFVANFLERLAKIGRVIHFDKRGSGASDAFQGAPTLEERSDDLTAVMDAAGCEQAAIFGVSEGGSMSALFAAAYPERVTHLALCSAFPRLFRSDDCLYGWDPEIAWKTLDALVDGWGEGTFLQLAAPTVAGDPLALERWARFERSALSPGAFRAMFTLASEIDIRALLASINVPTLVMHRMGDRVAPVDAGRDLAARIPRARYVEFEGPDHLPFVKSDEVLDHFEEFVTGTRPLPSHSRVLATILFTDIVGSTDQLATIGDSAWRSLLNQHDLVVRRHLQQFNGREIRRTGDGFLATFDGPARAISCAKQIRDEMTNMGLRIRSGLHTGECELDEGDIAGIAVHIGARVAAQAGPDEVLVSRTVRDLVAGSGIDFTDRGTYSLKGIPGKWDLFAAG